MGLLRALVTLVIAAPAFSAPFDEIVGDPPDPNEPEFIRWIDELTAARVAECRDVARATYYVRLGAAGGGGDGLTPMTAWTEPNVPSLQARLDGLGFNWRVLLKRGEMWRGTSGLLVNDFGAALGAWGDGHKPILTSFHPLNDTSPVTDGGWSIAGGVGTITLTTYEDGAVWVSRSAQDNRKAWDETQYYARVATSGDVVADSGTFHFNDTTGLLTVGKLAGDVWDELEASVSNDGGVFVGSSGNRVWIDGLHVSGWAMDSEAYCIRVSFGGERRALVSNCYADASNRHVIGAANGGAVGGISTFVGNEAGACRAINGATTYVGYASSEGEFLFVNNTTSGYKLTEPGVKQITSYYSHGSGGVVGRNRLAIVRGHRTLPNTSDYLPQLADLHPIAGGDAPEAARGFIVDEIYDGGTIDHSERRSGLVTSNAVRVNCWVRLPAAPATSGRTCMFYDPNPISKSNRGHALRSVFVLDYSAVTADEPFGIIRHTGSPGSAQAVVTNCLFHVVAPSNAQPNQAFLGFSMVPNDAVNFSGGVWRARYSTFQIDRPLAAGAWINMPNGAPEDLGWWGGQSGNAYYNMTATDGEFEGPQFGYDTSESPRELLAPREPRAGLRYAIGRARVIDTSGSPGAEPSLTNRGVVIGPGSGSACVADVTTQNAPAGDPLFGLPDGEVTSGDLLYFANQWITQSSGADLTTLNAGPGSPSYGVPDGEVSNIDLLYFVEFWLAGCP